jgi:lysozyme
MNISRHGLSLIKHYEALRLKSYPDPASPLAKAIAAGLPTAGLSGAPWTCGYGHTGPEVGPNTVYSLAEAEAMVALDAAHFVADVNLLLKFREIPQYQFDALVSFAFNLGSDIDDDNIAEGLGDSTLLRKVLAGDVRGAADEFPKWDRAGGHRMWGLTKRRTAERAMFLGAGFEDAIRIGEQVPRY